MNSACMVSNPCGRQTSGVVARSVVSLFRTFVPQHEFRTCTEKPTILNHESLQLCSENILVRVASCHHFVVLICYFVKQKRPYPKLASKHATRHTYTHTHIHHKNAETTSPVPCSKCLHFHTCLMSFLFLVVYKLGVLESVVPPCAMAELGTET